VADDRERRWIVGCDRNLLGRELMRVRLWGTRGSLATPGPDTMRYGGNTSCVEVIGSEGTVLVLDAGTGVRRLGASLCRAPLRRVDILLTHLHMDHIQGLGFFAPLYDPEVELHIWGPASTTLTLQERLSRYLSPPLFPVHLHSLPCTLVLHEVANTKVEIGELHVYSALVCHPGPTVGYRIEGSKGVMTYLPDHEPALGPGEISTTADWTSGFALAEGADLLIHDAQYSSAEYPQHVGWGHSSLQHACDFAALAGVKRLVPFHHDPAHSDDDLDHLIAHAHTRAEVAVVPGIEGSAFEIGPPSTV
jgi:phosphoribosyl 1,2-cyclic phosphodiesterase